MTGGTREEQSRSRCHIRPGTNIGDGCSREALPAFPRDPGSGSRIPNRGFTLIEVLVAVTIIAIIVAVAVVSIGGNDQRQIQREAERFAALVTLACEQAELSGRQIGVHLGQRAYGFSLATSDGWLPFGAGHRFHERELTATRLQPGAGSLPNKPEFEAEPQALCWPSGELSELDLRFARNDEARMRVRTAADARALIETSDDGRHWRALTRVAGDAR